MNYFKKAFITSKNGLFNNSSLLKRKTRYRAETTTFTSLFSSSSSSYLFKQTINKLKAFPVDNSLSTAHFKNRQYFYP